MVSYRDRTVVITGGAGGMGAAIARRFVAEGATVIVGDMSADAGEKLATELGERCRYAKLDVTDEADWRAILAQVDADSAPLAALVQCAGLVEYKTIEEGDPEMFRRIIDVNLFGTWLGMHVLGSALRATGEGVIVNFSSTQGIEARRTMAAYASSKWAVRGLTKTAALEFARDGIRVCSIHPGPTRTPMTAHLNPEQVKTQPIPRFGEPDEIAAMVWFFAAEATYSTGSEFVIDGGSLLGTLPIAD